MNPRQITCSVCNKPVEMTEWWDDRETNGRFRVLRVYCHGQTDEMRLDMLQMTPELLEKLSNAQGVAFATIPKGYALISLDALRAWGKLDEIQQACRFPTIPIKCSYPNCVGGEAGTHCRDDCRA